MVPHAGAGVARRPRPALGSQPLGRPAAVWTGDHGRRLSAELDSFPAAAGERPYRGVGARVVLRGDSPDGGRLLLSLLPQPGAIAQRQPRRRHHFQPLRLHGQHALARDDERRRLDPAGLPVPVARIPRPAARRQRGALRHVPGHRLSERTSSGPHFHRCRVGGGLDLPSVPESAPAGSRRGRSPVRRIERRHADAPRLRIRPPRQTLGGRAGAPRLESACPVLRARLLRPQGVQPFRHCLSRREDAFRSVPRSGRVLAGAVRGQRAVARRPRAPAGRARSRRHRLRAGPQQRLSGRALRPDSRTRQGANRFVRGGSLPVRGGGAGGVRDR